jgi:uncharacterized membrane protein
MKEIISNHKMKQMKIAQNIKFRTVSILLLFIFTIIMLSATKANTKKAPACTRIENQNRLIIKTFVNKKCQACHTNVVPE